MGAYINPRNTAFKEAVNSKIYIDKSSLISYTNSVLNTKQKNMCVSRPRRFGKSIAADMLVAYYSKGCDSAKFLKAPDMWNNPKSVVDALIWKEFQSYWAGTETYEALKVYIDMNFDGLTLLD